MGRFAALGTSGLILLAACASEPEPPRRVASGGILEPRPDWSMDLVRLMPAIRACLDHPEVAGPPVGVTKAWPIEVELVGVRLLEPDDSRVDCVATRDGARVLLTERVLAASRLQGERSPLFTPAPGQPPQSPCFERSQVAGGWLSYDVCRDPRPIGPAASGGPPKRRGGPQNG